MDGCAFCHGPIPGTPRAHKRTWCSKKCRQAAFRLRVRGGTLERAARPIRVAYADPPYPGLAAAYYAREPTYAGEVDHPELIARLVRDYPDGWALSTSAESLRDLLPLCPQGAHLCPWVKPIGVPPATLGLHRTWEALIVVGGRQRPPGVRDWLCAQPARRGGTLPGRKPLAFCAFLFRALGLEAGDELVDLYPGTGVVGRAWGAWQASADASPLEDRDASLPSTGDPSRAGGEDSSRPSMSDALPLAACQKPYLSS